MATVGVKWLTIFTLSDFCFFDRTFHWSRDFVHTCDWSWFSDWLTAR